MINTLSSGVICGTTLLRNQEGLGNKVFGAVGYALAATVAAVEVIASLVLAAISPIGIFVGSTAPISFSVKLLINSGFCFGWSIVDFFLNPFVHYLVADEGSARQILNSGNLCMIPRGALLALPNAEPLKRV